MKQIKCIGNRPDVAPNLADKCPCTCTAAAQHVGSVEHTPAAWRAACIWQVCCDGGEGGGKGHGWGGRSKPLQ